jgi:hypothetical protein
MVLSRAYVHCSIGRPGVDPGDGYSQSAELVFLNAMCSEPTSGCFGKISEGLVRIGTDSFGLLPLPCSGSGDIHAKFVFTSGTSLNIIAESFNCLATGSRKLIESYGG